MGNDVCFLLTLLCGDELLRVALKISGDYSADCVLFPMEPENRANLAAMLPSYIREIGPILGVERIYEVVAASAAHLEAGE